jgi:hypothetical protein
MCTLCNNSINHSYPMQQSQLYQNQITMHNIAMYNQNYTNTPLSGQFSGQYNNHQISMIQQQYTTLNQLSFDLNNYIIDNFHLLHKDTKEKLFKMLYSENFNEKINDILELDSK